MVQDTYLLLQPRIHSIQQKDTISAIIDAAAARNGLQRSNWMVVVNALSLDWIWLEVWRALGDVVMKVSGLWCGRSSRSS